MAAHLTGDEGLEQVRVENNVVIVPCMDIRGAFQIAEHAAENGWMTDHAAAGVVRQVEATLRR